ARETPRSYQRNYSAATGSAIEAPHHDLTISIKPSRKPGKLIGTSSDGHSCITSAGARHWQQLGAPSSAVITTIWSSGPGHWALRSTIGHAAKLTVKGDHFRPYTG